MRRLFYLFQLIHEISEFVFDNVRYHGSSLCSIEDIFCWFILERRTEDTVAYLERRERDRGREGERQGERGRERGRDRGREGERKRAKVREREREERE